MAQQTQRITPYIIVGNCGEALAYYEKYMSAKILERKETDDGKIIHSSFELPNGAQFMMCDDCAGGYSSRVLPKGTLCPIELSLNFASYKNGLKFWNDFAKNEDNIKDIKIDMEFGPQFWHTNFGKFICKYGYTWCISAPLDKGQKVPENPFKFKETLNQESEKEKEKESKQLTGNKRATLGDEKENGAVDGDDGEPPKKRQRMSASASSTSNDNSNSNDNNGNKSKNTSETGEKTGFKEIKKNVGSKIGLFCEFRVGKQDVTFGEAFKEGTTSVWQVIQDNKDNLNGKFSDVIAMSPDDPNRVSRARYIPGFLFDETKISKEELEKYETDNVKLRAIDASDWYVYLHCGSYDTMNKSWQNAINDMSDKGLFTNGNDLAYEHYLNDPSQTEVKDLRTLICIGIKSKE